MYCGSRYKKNHSQLLVVLYITNEQMAGWAPILHQYCSKFKGDSNGDIQMAKCQQGAFTNKKDLEDGRYYLSERKVNHSFIFLVTP